MEIALPTLRADLEIVETYSHREGAPLSCPITACGGAEDRTVDGDAIDAWRSYTSADFRNRIFPGDHFFVHASRPFVLKAIAEDLGMVVPREQS
jgi:surfactin synthase thioesterase subunit